MIGPLPVAPATEMESHVLRSALLRLVLLPFMALACSEGSGPNDSSVVGTYSATTFVVTGAGLHPVDYLAGGSTITITIAEDSSMTGELFIPDDLTGDAPFEVDMAGTAIVQETEVSFDQVEDSFMRDLTFTRGRGTLTANHSLSSGDHYHIRLKREN